jgi:hypothetical protein
VHVIEELQPFAGESLSPLREVGRRLVDVLTCDGTLMRDPRRADVRAADVLCVLHHRREVVAQLLVSGQHALHAEAVLTEEGLELGRRLAR